MQEGAPATDQSGFVYCHAGVRVSSEFEIPEWQAFGCSEVAASPEVVIRLGEVDCSKIGPADHGSYDGQCLNFADPEAGAWSICSGRSITVEIAAKGRMTEARLYTLGSAWGVLGYQRGWAMLHGSAIEMAGGAVLFAGGAGHGKSSLAAAMMERGARIVADDLSRIEPSQAKGDGPVLVYPSATRIKLWDEAVTHFGWQDRKLIRDHFRDNKFHVPLPVGNIETAPLPLRAVYVLEWGEDVSVERLRGAEAVSALAEATMYRKEYLELMSRLGEQIVHCAHIAASVPIYRLIRPLDFSIMDEVCKRVEQSLADE